MSYYLRVFHPDHIQDVRLENTTIVGDMSCPILGNSEAYTFHFSNDRYIVSSPRGTTMLEEGQYFSFSNEAKGLLVRLEKGCVAEVAANGVSCLTIGRNLDRDLVLPSRGGVVSDRRDVSREHATLRRTSTGWRIISDKPQAKVFLNGKRISGDATVSLGDIICIGKYTLVFESGKLSAYALPFTEMVNQNRTWHSAHSLKEAQKSSSVLNETHIRAPRLTIGYETGTINIERMPDAGGPIQFNWLSILVTPMISVALMLVLVFALGMSPIMLIMSGVMSVVSAIIAVVTYRKQKKQHNNKDSLIDTKYREYLDTVRSKISEAHKQQLESLALSNPMPVDCLQIAEKRVRTLWDRKPTDADFVSARIGTGTIPAAFQAKFQRPQISLQEKELENEAAQIADNSGSISGAPIICSFLDNRQTGVIGDRSAELQIARNIIVELATAHSFDELKIVVICPENERNEWEWVRWLPHCGDNAGKHRYLFCSFDEAESALEEISDVLSQRKPEDNLFGDNKFDDLTPHYFFVFAKYPWIERHSIRKLLLSEDNLGCSGLYIYDRLTVLPKECSQIIQASGQNGALFQRTNSQDQIRFILDSLTVDQADRFARSLAPLQADTEVGAISLPGSISFLQGYGVSQPEQLQIEKRWTKAKTYKSLAVPVASIGGNELFEFDIHEKHHGVNGIVAGMPGSGKTEMVQSWLLSLAVNYSPQDVSFVLIDFKGTGMIAPFRDIPHLAGAISNLDTNIDRNLKAIQSEVHRRESIIDKYSAKSVKNINDLNKAYAEGLVPEKLPILLIVIDEFAEFKKVFPDFGAEIDSLTSKGRALGMFVILMTQKPAGVVSAKSEDNIKFRWCLRVANYGASREMLGRPDAAKITNPGRCFVKVGEDEVFEEVQSLWSGAPYKHVQGTVTSEFVPICVVADNGMRTPCEKREKKEAVETRKTEIDVVVQYIIDFSKKNGIKNADQVWTARLPERLPLTDVLGDAFDGQKWPEKRYMSPVIGKLDDPANQKQYPLALDFAKSGSTLVYGAPVTGKTTLLQTLVLSLAMCRRPNEVSVYIMDFGGWNLRVFNDFPHVGGIASDDTPERMKKLMLLISDTIQKRKDLFSREGVGSIASYRQDGSEKLPDVILVVDNLNVLLKMYPETDSFFVTLASSGANYGVYLFATSPSANGVPMRITQNIKNTFALQMIDKSEYSYLVGKVNSQLPQIPGRGYAKGNPPLEFQTALPGPDADEKTITGIIRKVGIAMDAAWDGKRPDPIPEMPERIAYGSVRSKKIVLGLTADRIQPAEYDWESQHYLLISGTSQSGKSNLLFATARQLKEKLGGRIYLFDIKKTAPSSILKHVDLHFTEAAQINHFIESIRPELQKRQAEMQANRNASFEPMIFAIDDYSEFFAAVSNDTIARLLAVVKIGRGLGLYLIAAGSAYELTAMINKGESVLLSIGKANQVVMLGGCMDDHVFVQVNAGYNAKKVKVGFAEGYNVFNTEPTRIKTICHTEEV